MSEHTNRIRELNDDFRTTFNGGKVICTGGIAALDPDTITEIIEAVQSFNDWSDNNDPHHEHDFCAVQIEGKKIFAKIDYYDPSMIKGSEDPADPAQTTRVLTIMLASEY